MYKSGQHLVDEFFLVKDLQLKKAKNGKEFLAVNLLGEDGAISGVVWENNLKFCYFEINKVVKLCGLVESFNGNVNLKVESSVISNEDPLKFQNSMKTMIFDIECVGQPYDSLDSSQQEYLLDNLEKGEEDKEKAKNKAALYSIFGKVVAVGIYCPETKTGKVLAISNKALTPEKDNFEYEIFEDEKSLLIAFWKEVEKYTTYVTYNGDGFDWPYMVIRSGILRVKISKMFRRNDNVGFLDLQNVLKQSRAFKLEMLCKAFGVDNPKEEGVSGLHVHELFYQENYQTIADYVARDAYSTGLLYDIYREYLCP